MSTNPSPLPGTPPASGPTNIEKLRGLPWSIARNSFLTIFAQFVFFGSGFVLFLSELGLKKTQIGFLQSLVPFLGLIALFIIPAVARFGYKRTYLISWGIRYVISALLVLTPWVLSRYGQQGALVFIAAIVGVFALCRAIGVTALLPWEQEFIPNSVRGRYYATSNIFTNFTGFLAVLIAGYVIGKASGLDGFVLLFGVGAGAGILSLIMAGRVPGGKAVEDTGEILGIRAGGFTALQDRSFLGFLAGIGMITLATGPLISFLPLFMQEKVGLGSANVIFLQTGTLFGGLVSSYIWGWMSDRYGSRPVMLSGVFLSATLPIFWMIMPRQSTLSLAVAIGIAFLQGIANLGWAIGSSRSLFVSIVPPEKNTTYIAIYSAWVGLVGGVSKLAGGWLLDFTEGLGINGKFLFFTLDSYTILFALGIVLPLIGAILLWWVRTDSKVSMGQFAGLFLHGNPILAVESLIRYQFARTEQAAVTVTERLGQAKSPLTVEELLESLEDPRFYVRFEAIVAIAHHGTDDRLIGALVDQLNSTEPALSVISAWALGRIGDNRALEPLRAALNAPYRSIQAHAARSLGYLGDTESQDLLLERLLVEEDLGLKLAFASVLGKMQVKEATPKLVTLLHENPAQDAHKEITLALARLAGDENQYIHLLRDTQQDAGTTLAQSVLDFKSKWGEPEELDDNWEELVDSCADAFAREDLETGTQFLAQVIDASPLESYPEHCAIILETCAAEMQKKGVFQVSYAILALHTLSAAISP